MFTKRLISGIVLVILAILIVGQGGILLYATTALISLIGLFELYRVMKIEKNVLGAVGFVSALVYYGMVWLENGQQYVTLLAIITLMVLMSIYVFTFPKYKTEEITVAFFGLFYVPVMLSYLYLVRVMPDGAYLVWLVFFSSWRYRCSCLYYCCGSRCGRS